MEDETLKDPNKLKEKIDPEAPLNIAPDQIIVKKWDELIK